MWDTFQNYVSDTFAAFWFARACDGYDVSHAGSHGQRLPEHDRLLVPRPAVAEHVRRARPTPTPHNFRPTRRASDWSVVALRPQTGSNYDLDLYDDLGSGHC